MSLADTLIGHMIDPNNKLVTNMLAGEATKNLNETQVWLASQPKSIRAIYDVDNQGRLVTRTPDQARAHLAFLNECEAQASQPQSSNITNDDIARTLIAIANKLGI